MDLRPCHMHYIYICIPVHWRIKGSDWSITTRLVVIPQWLVVIPQQGNFKAPQSIINECVNTAAAAMVALLYAIN